MIGPMINVAGNTVSTVLLSFVDKDNFELLENKTKHSDVSSIVVAIGLNDYRLLIYFHNLLV